MSESSPDTLSRLRAANPAPLDHQLGGSAVAQATLQRILNGEPQDSRSTTRRNRLRIPRGGLGVALAVLCVGGGAAIAATNPFGWWSSDPSSARYAVDPSVHVRTPTAQEVSCHPGGSGFICTPGGSGQRYEQIDSVRLPGRLSGITRANFARIIARGEALHQITPAHAARLRSDLARVPDSFFVEFRLSLRYATIGTSDGRVPPAGVPEFLVCQNSGSSLSCQNLNGDTHAPIGAGIYGARPAPDWRPGPRSSELVSPLPPGISFTTADYRLLFDLSRFGAITTGGSRSGPDTPSGGG